jgi:hypothetical protein
VYGKFINDIFGGFFNLFASRIWGSEAESGITPIGSGITPIGSGITPIGSGITPIG